METYLIEAYNYNKSISLFLKEISFPLLEKFGLKLLTFRRFSYTGELLYIFNDDIWMDYSFNNTCWHSKTFDNRIKELFTKKFIDYIWPFYPEIKDPVYNALYAHNIWNGIIMYRKYENCFEAYAFASTKEKTELTHFYLNNIKILDEFILFFKDKANSFIFPKDKKVYIPHGLNLPAAPPIAEDKIKNFFEQTKVTKYFLAIKGNEINISEREAECLYYLSKGKAVKEIALLLKLSSRTIEANINNIKMKANATTSDLIEAFIKSKFLSNSFSNLESTTYEYK